MPGNKFEVQCCMASHMEWHQPVQEEADWLRLLLLKNEVRNIADTTPANPALISCIEWRPGLGCSCSKTDSIITHRHDHLST